MLITNKSLLFLPTIFCLMVITIGHAGTTSYQYDDLYRLKQVQRADGTVITYSYDELGNRLSKVVAPSTNNPLASFSASSVIGSIPLQISFSDQSSGILSTWAWDFDNDGTVDSYEQNPTFTYNVPGVYDVRLTVSSVSGSYSLVRQQYITATADPIGPVLSTVPLSRDVSYASGTTSIDVSNTGMGTMAWTAVSNSSWITITNGSSGSDSGTITANYSENTGQARTGTIAIEAVDASNSPQNVEIRQAAGIAVGTPLDTLLHDVFAGPVREYEINLVAGQGITAILDAHMTTGYLYFSLRDPNGVEIATSNDSQINDGERGRLERIVHSNGVHTLRINSSSGAEGNYDLTINNAWFNPQVTDAQRSYNSTFNTAHYIHNGNFNATASLPHCYRFTVQANTQVDISVSAHLSQGSLDFALYDNFGVELAGSNDSAISNGQVGVASRLIIEGGVYYVKVIQPSTAIGNYDLNISGVDFDGDNDGDGLYNAQEFFHGTDVDQGDSDNDGVLDLDEIIQGASPIVATRIPDTVIANALTRGTAYPVPFFDQAFNVEHSGTTTWYAVELDAGQGVSIVLSSHLEYGSLNFSFVDESGVELAASSDSAISDGQKGVANLTVTQGGTYYIHVTESSNAVGNYDLAVYDAWFNPGVVDSQRGFHGTFNTAHYIHGGNYQVTGSLPHLYRFTVQPNTQVDISVSSHLNRGSLDFELLDVHEVQLASSNDSSITNGQIGVVSRQIVEGGVYYVKVTQPTTAIGHYDLTISGADSDNDSDSDGLYNSQEFYHGTAIDQKDSDSDGTSDLDEIIQGASPLVATHIPAAAIASSLTRGTAYPIPFFDQQFNVEHSGTTTWYAVELNAGQGISIVLSSHLEYGSLDFSLVDGSGVELISSSDSAISDGQRGIANRTVTVGGTYYIHVTESSNAVGNYDLAVYNAWFNPGVVDSQREFHSTFNTAQYIHSGNYQATGSLPHVYRFTVQSDATVDISLAAHLNRGSLDFQLLDVQEVELASSNDISITNGQIGVASRLLVEGGVYYLKVTQPTVAIGHYDLTISGVDLDSDTDNDGLADAQEFYHGTAINYEDSDNDGISDCNEIIQGANPLVATHIPAAAIASSLTKGVAYPIPFFDQLFNVEHSGTTTWYAVELNAGQGISIVLSSHLEYGSLDFSFVDANGVELTSSSDSAITDGQKGVASRTVTAGGTYYVHVTESSNAVGNYDLAVYNAWFNPGVVDARREFHGTFNTAYYIHSGNYQATGSLPHLYRFTALPNAQVDISLVAHLNRGSLDFALYDSLGAELTSSNDSAITNGQIGVASRLLVGGGVYYLKVTQPSTAIGRYDLAISGVDLYPSYFGDINADSSIDLSDLIMSLQISSGGNPAGVTLGADINNDGIISLPEAIFIITHISQINSK